MSKRYGVSRAVRKSTAHEVGGSGRAGYTTRSGNAESTVLGQLKRKEERRNMQDRVRQILSGA